MKRLSSFATVLTVVLAAPFGVAAADAYPSKSIRMIAPYSPGRTGGREGIRGTLASETVELKPFLPRSQKPR